MLDVHIWTLRPIDDMVSQFIMLDDSGRIDTHMQIMGGSTIFHWNH